MFPAVWRRIFDFDVDGQPATLHGYAIFQIKDSPLPGIVPAGEKSQVRGTIYEKLDEETIHDLDAYESRFYQRHRVEVILGNGTVKRCETYVVAQSQRSLLTDMTWDAAWFEQHALKEYLRGG